MDSDPAPSPTIPRNRYRDFDEGSGKETPEPARRLVAENGVSAACKHRRAAAPVIRQVGAPDRVDATVYSKQPIRSAESADGAGGEPKLPQLLVRHDSILTVGERRQSSMRTHFFPHTGNKYVHVPGSPQGNVCSPA